MRNLVTLVSHAARHRAATVLALALCAVAMPRLAQAQYNAPPLNHLAIGENYHVELGATFWNPTIVGTVSSEEFGLLGTKLDFVDDLNYQDTRFTDYTIVLRPARKHRFRAEHLPIVYTANSILKRTIVFNGISFPATLPITSEFDWKVWRLGYEYDFFYASRGFVGVLLDVRATDFSATLRGPGRSEFTAAKAPLPSLGLVGRAYVAPNVALNVEVSGMNVPKLGKYQGHYYDWEIGGTVNLTNYFGVQAGYRRFTTFIDIDHDNGDFKLDGMYFGGAVRF